MVSGNLRFDLVCAGLLVAATIGVAGDALAQEPRQAQLNALRSSCRGDYMAHCSSVPTGGAPALNCLKQHMSALSGACQSAVNAISPPAAAPTAAPKIAAAPPPAVQAAPAAPPAAPPAAAPSAAASKAQRRADAVTIRRACAIDYHTHCAGIPVPEAAACLRRNVRTLSKPCLQALVAAPRVAAAAPPAAAPAPAPAPAAAPPAEPAPLLVTRREELFLMRDACGADFAAVCRGLRPGLGRVAACLHYNRGNLSPRCQQALIALHEGR